MNTMIRRYEEISNNAWPALQTFLYDGWSLRLAKGVTKRSNSVSMIYPSTLDPVEKINWCEALFLKHSVTPCFKITEITDPPELDSLLEQRGYSMHSVVSFQTMEIASLRTGTDPDGIIRQQLTEPWLGRFVVMNRFDPGRIPVYQAIMEQIITPCCFASVVKNGQIIAVGLGVLEGQFLGIFDLVVDPDFRRHGLALRIMHTILAWGKNNGASDAYLQVLTGNTPALRLYDQMGFRELYRYWYRMKG